MMSPSSFKTLIDKLPHRGGMLLIDAIVHIDESSVEALTNIDARRLELFGEGGKLESYVGVELMAQAAALPVIWSCKEEKDHAGVIAQVRSFQSYESKIDCKEALRTSCSIELLMDGKIGSVKGLVRSGETKICEGVLTLAMIGD